MDDFDSLDPALEAALAAADRLVEQRRHASSQGGASTSQTAPPVGQPGRQYLLGPPPRNTPGGSYGNPDSGGTHPTHFHNQFQPHPGVSANPPVSSPGQQRGYAASQGTPGNYPVRSPPRQGGFSRGQDGAPAGNQLASPGRQGAPAVSPGRRGNVRVSISLSEEGRVIAHSPYNEAVKNLCRSTEGRHFHPDSKGWSFPQAALPGFVVLLRQIPGVQVEVVPPLQLPVDAAPPVFAQPAIAPYSSPQRRPPPPKAVSPTGASPGVISPGGSQKVVHVTLRMTEEQGSSQETRFAAKFDFSQTVNEACRATPGRHWDNIAREWTFPLSSLTPLAQNLSQISEHGVTVETIPPLTLPPIPEVAQPAPPPPPSSVVQRLFQDTPPEVAANSSQGGTISSNSTPPEGLRSIPPEGLRSTPPEGLRSTPPKRKAEVTLGIYGRDRISVQFGYDQSVVGAVKTVRGAEWNATRRVWHVPFDERPALEAAFAALPNVDVSMTSLHPLVQKAMDAAAAAARNAAARDDPGRYDRVLGGEFKERLMEFQREGVKWALQQGARVFIADEMGLGKTVQALALAACYPEAWPILVVVPSSLRFTWAKMCVDWLHVTPDDVTVVVSTPSRVARAMGYTLVSPSGGKKAERLRLEGRVNILSYDILLKVQPDLVNANFQMVILDESHYIKNPAAQRTLCAGPLVQKALYAVLLSGTPALSRPIELQQQLGALCPRVYSDRREYGERYCQGGRQFYPGQEYMGASNLKELHSLLVNTIMVRRLKADVLQQLPPKLRQQVFLDIPDKAMAPVRKIQAQLVAVRARRQLAAADAAACDRLDAEERAHLNELYRETGAAKCGAAQDHVGMMLEHDEKFLVFAHHRAVLDAIEVPLKKWASRDNQYIRMDGSTPPAERTGLVARFQEEPKCKVALLSIKAAGVGLTLHAAQTVVFTELSWLPGDLLQAEDRCHRIGQVSSVNVLYLLAQETSDDIMWESVRRKLENVGEVLNGVHDQMSVNQQHRLKGRPLNQPLSRWGPSASVSGGGSGPSSGGGVGLAANAGEGKVEVGLRLGDGQAGESVACTSGNEGVNLSQTGGGSSSGVNALSGRVTGDKERGTTGAEQLSDAGVNAGGGTGYQAGAESGRGAKRKAREDQASSITQAFRKLSKSSLSRGDPASQSTTGDSVLGANVPGERCSQAEPGTGDPPGASGPETGVLERECTADVENAGAVGISVPEMHGLRGASVLQRCSGESSGQGLEVGNVPEERSGQRSGGATVGMPLHEVLQREHDAVMAGEAGLEPKRRREK